MKKSFAINPSTNMLDVLGHSGYTFDAAIADIIDNSISAKAKNISICFDVKKEKTTLYILDDGEGMNLEKLHQCIVPAYQDIDEIRSDDDLGRYSLGLKSASKSFCNQLYVCSKTVNGNANTVELDFEHIKKSHKWEAFEIDYFEYSNLIGEKGTIVFWDNVNFKNSTNRLDDNVVYEIFDQLEISLSHIFGKYIIEDGLNIYIFSSKSTKNKKKICGWNPFYLQENKDTAVVSEKEISFNGSKIVVNSYILPVYSNLSKVDQDYMVGKGLIEQEGFYIYRNKRLIQEGGWMDLPNIKSDQKCEYARIEVNIGTNLDKEFDVNFSKFKVIIPNELIKDFTEIANYARTKSRKNYEYVKNPELKPGLKKKKDNIPVWQTHKTDDGIKLNINLDHPVLKQILSKLTQSERKKVTSLISKTLPISMLQSQGGVEDKFEEKDIKDLIKDTYIEMRKVTDNISEIKKKMFKTEPFNMYLSELSDFFESMEENKND